MTNDTPTTQRYYAVHRLIEATANYPTFYIHHIADLLLKHQLNDTEDSSNNDRRGPSLPQLKLGYGNMETGNHTTSPNALPRETKTFVLKLSG